MNTHSHRTALLVFFVIIFIQFQTYSQDVTIGVSTMHDENIFDTYNPMEDQITDIGIDLSKGWNHGNSYFGVYYAGSYSFYRNLTTRNFHLHMAMLGFTHHYRKTDNEETDSPEETRADSTSIAFAEPAEGIESTIEYSDSLDNYLNVLLVGASQLNKVDYQNWNNTMVKGTATFRQPLGLHVSIRPTYALAYHSYPNLTALTNIQNTVSLSFGTDILPMNWFGFISSIGVKSYPVSQSATDTIQIKKDDRGGHDNGNGSSGTIVSYNFSTPSVHQLLFTFLWNYSPAPGTQFRTHITKFNTPSAVARTIPELRKGTAKFINQLTGVTFGQNEFYDDHYSFSGNGIGILVEQLVPYEIILSASWQYQTKTYTYAARDLVDSVVASNREDTQKEIIITLSKTFSLGEEQGLKAQIEYRSINNRTNAAYFDFKKNMFLASVELSF